MASEFTRFAAWTAIPAGSAILLRGLWIWSARRARRESGTAGTLSLARGLRAVLVGGALIACGICILREASVLFAIGLAIGAEELLETSAVIFALRDELPRRSISEGA